MDLIKVLEARGYPTSVNLDGQFVRFDRTKPLSGWFIGRSIQGGRFGVAYFGDWAAGERHEWKSTVPADSADAAIIQQELERLATTAREEKERLQNETAERCQGEWEQLSTLGNTAYLERKGIQGLHGARIEAASGGNVLCVPCRDITGKLWGIQRIQPDGEKRFTRGQRIKGCFHVIGELGDNPAVIHVAEGFATAASVHYGLSGLPVVSAFNSGNLLPVCLALKARFPQARIVVCADNDAFTKRPDGTPWNPGLEAGHEAADAVGATVRYPVFAADLHERRPTDFNDAHTLLGLDEVKRQLSETRTQSPAPVITQPLDSGPGFGVLAALPWRKGEGDAKPKPPAHQVFAKTLLDHYGENICKQVDDLFVYEGTHWVMYDKLHRERFLKEMQILYGGKADIGKLKALVELFMIYVPTAPVDMFQPRITMANFLNGTLHAERGEDYNYQLFFLPHCREDYLTHTIPVAYEEGEATRNEEFEAMVERVFSGDPDASEKVRAVRQMYGACLMPLYPHLFLLHGPQGSGKTSLIIPAQRLVHQDNWCSVEPHEFKDFNMETSIGKIVNFVTDINTNRPIEDAQIKKIEDRVPMRIDRKFKEAIYTPLPATHIFGGNSIPPTTDGGSGAHTRRWTFIEVSKYRATDGHYKKDFGNWVFEQCPVGVLNFALQGLRDVIASEGHFLNPASGKEAILEWQQGHDPVAAFFKAIDEDGLESDLPGEQIIRDEQSKIRCSALHKAFVGFERANTLFPTRISRVKFHAACRARGLAKKVLDGIEYYAGFGVRVPGSAKQ